MLLECRFQVLVCACVPYVQRVDSRQRPSSHRATCWCPTLPSLSSKGSEVEKHKKVYGSGQRQFNRRKEARRWHKGNHSPPSTSKPMPSQSPSSRHPGRQPPSDLLPLLPVFMAEHNIDDVDYPPDQFWSAVPALCPPNLLPTPCLLTRVRWGGEGGKKTLTLCKHCSATTKTPACYQHCFSHRSKTQHRTGCFQEI